MKRVAPPAPLAGEPPRAASPFAAPLGELELALPLKPAFRFAHEPIHAEAAQRFVGRQAELDAVTQRLLFAEGGSYLITGYRGVGKTSFVNQVVHRLEQALPWARAFLGDVEVLHVQLTLARRLQPAELMHHIVRRLYEELADRGLLAQLPAWYRSELTLAYQRTSLNMTRKLGSSGERTFGVPEMTFGLPGAIQASTKGLFGGKGGWSRNEESSFLSYDDRAAEHDVIRLSRALARGLPRRERLSERIRRRIRRRPPPTVRFKLVFVFDELDKLDDAAPAADAGPAPDADGSPEGSAEKARQGIEELINALKTLFTTSGISFVFVAGKDLHEKWIEDVGKGDSVYESVFAYDRYLPCLWEEDDLLCDPFVDWDALRSSERCPVCRGPLRPRGSVCVACGRWLLGADEAARLLAEFKSYLAFVGRGIPRRIIRGFNEHVRWHDQRPFLVLDPHEVRRVRFFAHLQKALEANDERLFGDVFEDVRGTQQDRRRLGVYYLIDWILRRRSGELTFADALQAASLLSRKIAPTAEVAPKVVRGLIDVLVEQDYLEEVTSRPDETRVGELGEPPVKRYRVVPRRLVEMGDRPTPLEADVPPAPPLDGLAGAVDGARYQILEEVARGGMGTLYTALDRTTGRTVALKLLPRHLSADPAFVERFRREAGVLAQLQHPRIVRFVDTGDMGGQLFIAMDYVQGLDLARLLAQRGALDLRFALSIARDVAEAIAFAHSRGFVRLDVKPGNILVAADGRAVLSDLGLSKRLETDRPEEDLTRVGDLIGTPAYMSPEQARGEPVDQRTDVYSFGVVLYEMLAGRPPFHGGSTVDLVLAQVSQQPPRLSSLVQVPAALDALVMRCLEKAPGARFQRMDELLALLDLLLDEHAEVDPVERSAATAELVEATISTVSAEREREKKGTELLSLPDYLAQAAPTPAAPAAAAPPPPPAPAAASAPTRPPTTLVPSPSAPPAPEPLAPEPARP
jgi:serine/threonine protein kinase